MVVDRDLDVVGLHHLLDGVERRRVGRDEDQREAGVLRVLEVLLDLRRIVRQRDGAAAGDLNARGLDLRAERARHLGRIGARQVHVLERHRRHAERLRALERLVERQLAHRVGRDAELQARRRRADGCARAGPAVANAAAAAAAMPTNSRRETWFFMAQSYARAARLRPKKAVTLRRFPMGRGYTLG